MDKRIVYIGIIALIFDFIILFASPQFLFGSLPTPIQVSLNSGHYTYMPISLNSTGLVMFYFNASNPVNFYFMNSTAFGVADNYVNQNVSLQNATIGDMARIMNGTFVQLLNSTEGAFPTPSQNLTSNQSEGLLTPGSYYAIFSNTGDNASTITLITKVTDNIDTAALNMAIAGAIMFVLFIAGLGLLLYGIFKRSKISKDDKEVDVMYEKVDNRKTTKAISKKTKPAKKQKKR